jgi:hypothetical protein
MMIKTVYLHIGLHKTASSSIQQSLMKSSELLRTNNYLYPLFSRSINGKNKHLIPNHSGPFHTLFSENALSNYGNIIHQCDSQEKLEQLRIEYLDQLKNEIRSFSGENLIISGEAISIFKIDELLKLKQLIVELLGKETQLFVIAFVRNPVSLFSSGIQEKIKHGKVLEVEYSRKKIGLIKHFSSTLLAFERVFGRENIKVAKFEDAIKHDFGPVGFFLELIGFNNSLLSKLENLHVNSSMSYEATVLLSAVNEQIPLLIDNRVNEKRLLSQHRILKKIPGQKFTLSREQVTVLWNKSTQDIQWLHDNYSIEPYKFPSDIVASEKERWSITTIKYIKQLLPELDSDVQKIIVKKLFDENIDTEISSMGSLPNNESIQKLKIFPDKRNRFVTWLNLFRHKP